MLWNNSQGPTSDAVANAGRKRAARAAQHGSPERLSIAKEKRRVRRDGSGVKIHDPK
jgi:hypothetical protein